MWFCSKKKVKDLRKISGLDPQPSVRDNYPQAKRLGVMSTPKEGKHNVEAQHSPYDFYVKLGFRQTAEPDEDNEHAAGLHTDYLAHAGSFTEHRGSSLQRAISDAYHPFLILRDSYVAHFHVF